MTEPIPENELRNELQAIMGDRVAEAYAKHLLGMKPDAIAAEMNVDYETVCQYVSDGRAAFNDAERSLDVVEGVDRR
mgnify:CR=1 FL=1